MNRGLNNTENMDVTNSEKQRLHWRCRRGMLELDILLNAFVENGYTRLSPEQATLFENILEYPDQVLYDLVLQKTRSADKKISELITLIRKEDFGSEIRI